jgi:hypothetical protein
LRQIAIIDEANDVLQEAEKSESVGRRCTAIASL